MKKQLNKKELAQRENDIKRITSELESEMSLKRRIFLEATRNILQNEVNTGVGHVFNR